eukprot:350103-Amorphochlora_amoeboformis.AAC.1
MSHIENSPVEAIPFLDNAKDQATPTPTMATDNKPIKKWVPRASQNPRDEKDVHEPSKSHRARGGRRIGTGRGRLGHRGRGRSAPNSSSRPLEISEDFDPPPESRGYRGRRVRENVKSIELAVAYGDV